MRTFSGILFPALSVYVVPSIGFALTMSDAYNATILFFYGAIGFFGALALLYFFGGFIVYITRLGQEYRQEGLYHMLHGIRILMYILVAVLVLKLLE